MVITPSTVCWVPSYGLAGPLPCTCATVSEVAAGACTVTLKLQVAVWLASLTKVRPTG